MELKLGDLSIDATNRTVVMGILNVSIDSPVAESIVAAGAASDRLMALRAAGAEIIDVGARSTRLNAQPMSAQEEIERVCPAIEFAAGEGIATSVDTWSAEVARAAAQCGVHALNDVTGFSDPEMVRVAADFGLVASVMHMRGRPGRHEVDQTYADIGAEVTQFLRERAAAVEVAEAGQVWLDPGFGFGKSAADNVRLLHALPELISAGRPVLISASRKGFLGELLGHGDVQDFPGVVEATLAFNSLAARLGAHVVRVHDVGPVVAALRVVEAVRRASPPPPP